MLRPLASLASLATGHMPGQRVPQAGGSLGAAAARALGALV